MSQTLTSSAYPPWTLTLQVLACMPQLLHLLRAEGLHASKANRQQEAHVLRKALSALGSNSCDDVPQVSAIGNDQVSRLELWRVRCTYFWAICVPPLATNYQVMWQRTSTIFNWTISIKTTLDEAFRLLNTSNKKSMRTLYHSKTAGPVAHVQTPRMRPLN